MEAGQLAFDFSPARHLEMGCLLARSELPACCSPRRCWWRYKLVQRWGDCGRCSRIISPLRE